MAADTWTNADTLATTNLKAAKLAAAARQKGDLGDRMSFLATVAEAAIAIGDEDLAEAAKLAMEAVAKDWFA